MHEKNMEKTSITPLVEMKKIVKIYPDGTIALKGVDLRSYPREILGLLGENGAGKTTLMKILSGILSPTEGEIFIGGKKVRFKNPSDALELGIGMVHQHFTLVPPYTAFQNIVLGIETLKGKKFSLIRSLDEKEAKEKIHELMQSTGLEVPLDTPVEKLPLGLRQRVEILKVLYRGVNVLILDEPTTFLTPLEVESLFEIMRRLRDNGKTVIFISHKIREALTITDRIMVLRGGKVVGEIATNEATPQKLAEMMVGPGIKLDVVYRAKKPFSEKSALEIQDLWVKNDMGSMAVKGVSLNVYSGEILGIAGVEGNGQDELIEAITGLRRVENGKVLLMGKDLTNKGPIDYYKEGTSHIPGDRDKYGLVLEFTLVENSVLGRQWEPGFTKGMRLDWNKAREYTKQLIKNYHIIASSIDAKTKSLSGGNRQRLVVARELSKEPEVIIAVHPTRGLDIASTMYIRETLARKRDEGKAVLLVSADLDEIFQVSDRIAVIYEGKILGIKKADETNRKEIGLLMGGVKE